VGSVSSQSLSRRVLKRAVRIAAQAVLGLTVVVLIEVLINASSTGDRAVVAWCSVFFWCGIGGAVGYAIGNGKGRRWDGFWLGFVLGLIGWIIIGLMSPTPQEEARRASVVAAALQRQAAAMPISTAQPSRQCPWCAETIMAAAILCRYCGREVEVGRPEVPPSSYPAGWYDDPGGVARARYWDGQGWTTQTQD
jgi:hypothetical protein